MPVPYSLHEDSMLDSHQDTLNYRRRSSVSSIGQLTISTSGVISAPRSPTAPIGAHSTTHTTLRQPFTSAGIFNERTGEISLPSSPSLASWRQPSTGSSSSGSSATSPYFDEKEKSSGKTSPTKSRFHLHAYGTRARLPPSRRGHTFQLPRPWISVIALTAFILSFFFLLSYLVPSSSPYTIGAASVLFRKTAKCDPYASFGTMYVDPHDADANQWVPFDAKCRPPAFLAKLRDERTTTDFSWLYNRTALVIGDQISREHVENFCTLMGEEFQVVRDHHKYNPGTPAFRMPSRGDQRAERPGRLSARSTSGSRSMVESSRSRICYIPKYDFMLVSVFHFGLDQEDYWRNGDAPQYTAPGMFEHRLTDVVDPIVAALRADGRSTAPDFVEVSSGVWDLARWAQEDIASQQQTSDALAQDRVTWYRFRVGQTLEKVRRMFPNAKAKTWRTLHYPLDQAAEKDYFFEKIAPRTSNGSSIPQPPFFSHARINQLDQAVRTLLLPVEINNVTVQAPHSDFRLNEWGTMLKGSEAHQRDRLHGDPLPGGYLWGDVMLYELWRGVLSSERQPLRSYTSATR